MAQISNINDMVVDDFNGDGHLDVLTVNNWFVSEIETPRNDAGSGLLLVGDGKGSFKAMSGLQSGFWAKGDARKAVPVTVGDGKLVLVANNDGPLQVFTVQNE
jgi:hypothetical protein